MYFLKTGNINVEIPLSKSNSTIHFDSLSKGSCFCAYSSFHEEKKLKFNFKAQTDCTLEYILARDILKLEKEVLDLSDDIKELRIRIETNENSEFDFYRF